MGGSAAATSPSSEGREIKRDDQVLACFNTATDRLKEWSSLAKQDQGRKEKFLATVRSFVPSFLSISGVLGNKFENR